MKARGSGLPSADARLPASRGVLDSLLGLVTPLHFAPRMPTESGRRYAAARRGIEPLADVYLPDGEGPYPSVVLVHGGGFVVGSRAMKPMRLLATRLAEAGFAAMTFDYRMILRGGRLGESMADARAAVSWWHAESARYRLDTGRVAMMGLSAGAALTILTAAELPAAALSRLVCVFGPSDFAALEGRRAALMRRLLLGTGDPAAWRRRSPLEASDRVPHPLLLIHGTADELVPVEHSRWLADRRRRMGLPVEARYIDDAPHAFFNEARLTWAAEEALRETLRFLGP